MLMKTNSAVLAAALLLSGTINAGATAIVYTDPASWSMAVPSSTALAIPEPASGFQYFDTGSVKYEGVSFSTSAVLSNGFLFNVGSAFSGSPAVLSSQQQTEGAANILITLAAPVKAFSLKFDTYDGVDDQIFNGAVVSFKLSNGNTLTLGSAGDAYDLGSFFGVTDDTPFQTILLTSLAPALNINDLNFGAAVAPIPEPATWVMLLLGFVGIGIFGARLPARRVSAQ